jgi:hypothetical protein
MSLEYLRKEGYECVVVEQTVRFPDKNKGKCPCCHATAWTMFKRDLWNIADILAVKPSEPGVLLVQTTTTSNASARYSKIKANPVTDILLKAGNRIHVHGWAKQGPRGKRKVWTLKVYDLAKDASWTEDNPVSTTPVLEFDSAF